MTPYNLTGRGYILGSRDPSPEVKYPKLRQTQGLAAAFPSPGFTFSGLHDTALKNPVKAEPAESSRIPIKRDPSASPSSNQTFSNLPNSSFARSSNANPEPALPECTDIKPFPFGTCPQPSMPQNNGEVFSTPVSSAPSNGPFGHLGPAPLQSGHASRVPDQPGTYNVFEEEPPQHAFFAPELHEALNRGRTVAARVAAELDRAAQSSQDDKLRRLASEAHRLSVWEPTASRKMAILGDSGHGKSSLINSLLHQPGLACTSDMGSACTSVVTEYLRMQPSQTAPIAIEAEYLSGPAVENVVKELAWSYRQYYQPNVRAPGAVSEEEYASYENESAQAWSSLEAAFSHHPGFSAQFLQDNSPGAAERVNEQLIQWARQIEWPTAHSVTPEGSSRWVSTAQTAEECCDKTNVFMEDALWPFTKIIRVFLNSPILNAGVILADLPGLHDTNLARVKATQEYILQCDNILIVSRITRAITDHSLRSSLFSVVARHVPTEWEESGGRSLKLAVVCTGSDDIKIRDAKAKFCGENKIISRAAIQLLEEELEAAQASGDHAGKKEAKMRLQFALAAARSAHVTEALQSKYSAETGGHLDVFCVGNTAYEKHCKSGAVEFVNHSGIPDLRRFCQGIVADAQLREAGHFMTTLLPKILNSVDLWTSGQTSWAAFDKNNRVYLLEYLDKLKPEVPEHGVRLCQTFMESFKDLAGYWESRQGSWNDAAAKEYVEWQGWAWNSFAAWCRKNGDHRTPAKGKVDWNAQIICKMRKDLKFQWDVASGKIPEVFTVLSKDVSRRLAELKNGIIGMAATEQRDLLANAVDHIDQTWKHRVNLEEEKLAREIGIIRQRASESGVSCYIVQAMLATYRAASLENGAGMSARQREIVKSQIESGKLFQAISEALSVDMEELARKTEESVTMLVGQVLQGLERDVHAALGDGERAMRSNLEVARVLKSGLGGLKVEMATLAGL